MKRTRPASYDVRVAVKHVVRASTKVEKDGPDYHLLRQAFATLDSLHTRMKTGRPR